MAELAPPWRGEVESAYMHWVYILQGKDKKHYIGCTSNLSKRIRQHNQGQNKSTSLNRPWQLVVYRVFEDQKQAYRCEKLVKSYKGGNAFIRIINGEVAEWSKAAPC